MKTLTSARFAVDFYELTKDQHENPEKYRGWSYGLDSLTKALGGIRRNQFILLGDSQKSGKTTLGLNVAAASYGCKWQHPYTKQNFLRRSIL